MIEPAKGEYKLEFGGMPGIHIFTTNPKYYNMLQINPFAFPEEVHVLEMEVTPLTDLRGKLSRMGSSRPLIRLAGVTVWG